MKNTFTDNTGLSSFV